jgi:hypothetical protein
MGKYQIYIDQFLNSTLGKTPENKLHHYVVRKFTDIFKYDLEGNYLTEYKSIVEASLKNKIKREYIRVALSGASMSAGGFLWSYKKMKKLNQSKKYSPKAGVKKRVLQFDLNGKLIGEFASLVEAQSRVKGSSIGNISNACSGRIKTCAGFVWKFETK